MNLTKHKGKKNLCFTCRKKHKPFLIKHTVRKGYVVYSPLCLDCFKKENKKNWEIISNSPQ